MHEFLCTVFIEVAISAGALVLFNAFPLHHVLEGMDRNDPRVKRDTVFWVKASLYYFLILLALTFPLKYLLTNHICTSK